MGRRTLLLVVLLAGVWLAATGAVGTMVISALAHEGKATIVNAAAAVVQAVAAAAVVILTIWLAGTATQTQKVADDRLAQLTAQAAELAHRDRQLLESPTLRLDDPQVPAAGSRNLRFGIHNLGASTAYDVRVVVHGKDDRDAHLPNADASGHLDTVLPSKSDGILVDMTAFEEGAAPTQAGGVPTGLLSFPWLAITVTCRGVLGQTATEEFSLWADAKPRPILYHDETRIQPSENGAEVVIRFQR